MARRPSGRRRNYGTRRGLNQSSMRQGGRSAPPQRSRLSFSLPRPLTAVLSAVDRVNQLVTPRRVWGRVAVPSFRAPPPRRSKTDWRALFGPSVVFRPQLRAVNTPCQQRRSRKEVMFAAGVAGRTWNRGGGPSPPRKRTILSNYSCR